jgi:CRP-like cAMP-binding protein
MRKAIERTAEREPLGSGHPPMTRLSRMRRNMHGTDQCLKALHSFALSRGTVVRYAGLPDGIGGCVEGGRIVLRADLTAEQEILTLVHELTHVMAHVASVRAGTPRTICEYEAEAVERLIAERLGFAAAEFGACLSDSPPFPEGLLADSVTRVRGVARTLIAVVSSRRSLATFTPGSRRHSRAAVVRHR